MRQRALVLDFGGVVSKTLFETHALSERALGLPPGTLAWRGPFDPAGDPLWCRMQAGEISERDYWLTRTREVGALLGRNWTRMEELVRAARGAEPEAIIRPEAVAAIDRAAAAGHPLAILSNELDLFYGADLRRRLSLLERFAVIVDATYTDILKPDPRAYLQAAAALGLPAEACVFLDDQPRNVEGARRVGMTALQFDVRQPGASFAAALAQLGAVTSKEASAHAP